jgi:hypothetical protein
LEDSIKYIFVDGVYFDTRIGKRVDSVPVLVVIGVKKTEEKRVVKEGFAAQRLRPSVPRADPQGSGTVYKMKVGPNRLSEADFKPLNAAVIKSYGSERLRKGNVKLSGENYRGERK